MPDATPSPKRSPIDLDALGEALDDQGAMGTWVLDLETGETLLLSDDLEDDSGDPSLEDVESDTTGRFHVVTPEGSRAGFFDMRAFADTVENTQLRERLDDALAGKGAFRRFKDVLLHHPQERERWFAYSLECRKTRARQWLEKKGLVPSP